MEWMFVEPAPTAWPVAGLTVAGLATGAGLVARRRAAGLPGSVVEVFWRDAATIAYTLAAVLAVPSLAALVPVEGIGQPIWIVVGSAASVAAVGLLAVRWRGQGLGAAPRRRPLTPTAAPERRLIPTGWEIGMVVAGMAGLGTYLISAGHAFGHPIHWLIAVLGLLIGYAFGIGLVTPRFTLAKPGGRRT